MQFNQSWRVISGFYYYFGAEQSDLFAWIPQCGVVKNTRKSLCVSGLKRIYLSLSSAMLQIVVGWSFWIPMEFLSYAEGVLK